jgi:hypothetical protein
MTIRTDLQVQLNKDFRVRHSAPDPTAVWRLLRVDDSPPTGANTENSKPFAMRNAARGFFMLKNATLSPLSHTVMTLSQAGLELHQAKTSTLSHCHSLSTLLGVEQMFAFFDSCAGVVYTYSIYILHIVYIYLYGTMDSPEAEKQNF